MPQNKNLLEKRQNVREPAGYAVQIFLRDKKGQKLTKGKVAFIRDISFSGIGVILPKIIVEKHHLFYEAQKEGNQLYLQHKNKEEQSVFLEVLPKWYRRGEGEERCYFYLGAEFVQDNVQDEIFELINVTQNTIGIKKSWLASLFSF